MVGLLSSSKACELYNVTDENKQIRVALSREQDGRCLLTRTLPLRPPPGPRQWRTPPATPAYRSAYGSTSCTSTSPAAARTPAMPTPCRSCEVVVHVHAVASKLRQNQAATESNVVDVGGHHEGVQYIKTDAPEDSKTGRSRRRRR